MHGIGERIKAARESLGWDKTQLAEALGVTRHTVGKWENGDIKTPRPELLFKLARKLHRDPEWLFTGREPVRDATAEQQQLLKHFTRLAPAVRKTILALVRSLPSN